MKRLMFFVALFFPLKAELYSQTALHKALENFALSVTNNLQTSDTTPESINEDLQYFELDIDGDGNDEIFVSRPDWISNDTWMLYQRLDKSDSEIKNLGIATIHAPSVRSGERDGKNGYYESYHYYGDNTDRLVFNAFDEHGILVALLEETIDSGGKDKELWDSIYTEDSSGPEIKSIPVAPLRAGINNPNIREDVDPLKMTADESRTKKARIRDRDQQAEIRDRKRLSRIHTKQSASQGSSGAGGISSRAWYGIAICVLIFSLISIYQCRKSR